MRKLNQEHLSAKNIAYNIRLERLHQSTINKGSKAAAHISQDIIKDRVSKDYDPKTNTRGHFKFEHKGVFSRNKKYKKGEKVWHTRTDFLNWIETNEEMQFDFSMPEESEIHFDGADTRCVFKILYRQLNMLPGHRYKLVVKWGTGEPAVDVVGLIDNNKSIYNPPLPDTPAVEKWIEENPKIKMHWKAFPAIQVACCKSFNLEEDEAGGNFRGGYYDQKFSDSLSENAGEVVCNIDFSNLEKIPGYIQIGALRQEIVESIEVITPAEDIPPSATCTTRTRYPSFFIDSITVVDVDSGETVYSNDFEGGIFEAVEDTDEEQRKNKKWRKRDK
jgi:hypothetical protein